MSVLSGFDSSVECQAVRAELIDAVRAADDDDRDRAKQALWRAAGRSSWAVVARRLTVADRALRVDAAIEHRPAPVLVETVEPDPDRLWPLLVAIAALLRSAGYPPEVIA